MTITVISVILAALLIGGFGLAFFVGAIFVQIYLAKKENKWLGYILPGICLLFSFMAMLGMSAFQTITFSEQTILSSGTEMGQIMQECIETPLTTLIIQNIALFVVYNIPTVILLIIFVVCRKKRNRNHGIDKMNILDL